MITVGLDNQDRGLWHRGYFRPFDGVKEDGVLRTEKGGRPEFRFAGGVEGVPGKKALPMVLKGLGIETQWGRVAA